MCNYEYVLSSGTRVGLDMCFGLNKRGEEGANCGRNKFGYTPCTAQYVLSTIPAGFLSKVYYKIPLKETWHTK